MRRGVTDRRSFPENGGGGEAETVDDAIVAWVPLQITSLSAVAAQNDAISARFRRLRAQADSSKRHGRAAAAALVVLCDALRARIAELREFYEMILLEDVSVLFERERLKLQRLLQSMEQSTAPVAPAVRKEGSRFKGSFRSAPSSPVSSGRKKNTSFTQPLPPQPVPTLQLPPKLHRFSRPPPPTAPPDEPTSSPEPSKSQPPLPEDLSEPDYKPREEGTSEARPTGLFTGLEPAAPPSADSATQGGVATPRMVELVVKLTPAEYDELMALARKRGLQTGAVEQVGGPPSGQSSLVQPCMAEGGTA